MTRGTNDFVIDAAAWDKEWMVPTGKRFRPERNYPTRAVVREAEDRLLDKVCRSPDGCWVWTGTKHYFGYGAISIRGRTARTHRLSYLLFCGPIPEGLLVRHNCDNPGCVRPDHLQLGTTLDNCYDRVTRGRQSRGERHGRSKLTAEQVNEIRRRRASGELLRTIAADFGISPHHACNITRGKFWKPKGLMTGHASRVFNASAVRISPTEPAGVVT